MSYIDKTMGRGETPIMISRRHIIVLFGYAFKWLGLFLASFIGAIWLTATWQTPPNDPVSTFKTVVILALFALALLSVVALLANYIRWYNEVYVLSNRRVMRIQGIFNKDEIDSSLDKLNDTKEHQSFWGRIFGYGTVEILTASQEGIDQLDYVPNPLQFRRAIQDAKNGFYNQANQTNQINGVVAGQTANPNLNAPMQTGVFDRNGFNNYPQGQPQVYQGRHTAGVYQPPMANGVNSVADNAQIKPHDVPGLIQQLANLRDSGVITEAEFQAKKADLFSRM